MQAYADDLDWERAQSPEPELDDWDWQDGVPSGGVIAPVHQGVSVL